MISLTRWTENVYRWYGFQYRGDLDIHWLWIFAAGILIAATLAYGIARYRARQRDAVAGGPYKAQVQSLQQTLATVKQGFEQERAELKRLNEATVGPLPTLFNQLNATLGPAYPANSTVSAIDVVKGFQEWGGQGDGRAEKPLA